MSTFNPWTECFVCSSPAVLFQKGGSLRTGVCCDAVRHRANWVCRKGRGGANKKESSPNRSRSAKRSTLYDAMSQYAEHFRLLLQAELDAEQISFKAQRHSKSRIASSDNLFGLMAKKRKRLFSNEIYQLTMRATSDMRWDHDWGFSKGDLVDLSPDYDGANDTDSLQGVLLSKSRGGLVVAFSLGSEAASQMDGYANDSIPLHAERGTNTVSYDRAVAALDRLIEKGPGTPDIARLIVMSFALAVNQKSMSSIHLFEPQWAPTQNDNDSGKTWASLAGESVRNLQQPRLNEIMKQLPPAINTSQRAAIRKALRSRLTLIQGPPGTGKTFTSAHAIACTLRLGLGPVLACAASNVATDNLSRKIVQACGNKTRVVRVGRPSSVAEDLWEICLDGLLERNARVRDARDGYERGSTQYSDLQKVQRQICLQILQSADVVLTTCVGSGMDEMSDLKFPMVVIDEATQATEMDVLIALCSSSALPLQLILVGDHHQLPPTTLSTATEPNSGIGLETSMFLRLWMSGVPCELLDTQFRMHPSISRFPNVHFYKSKLKDGVTEQDRHLPENIKSQLGVIQNDTRVVLINVPDGVEEKDQTAVGEIHGTSFSNHREATVAIGTARLLCNCQSNRLPGNSPAGIKPEEIGVISPYAGQVRTIRANMTEDSVLRHIEVNTVDGFQGREKDIIIISTVRSNKNGNVGFLSDWRRLNVAITRARLLVIIVCNTHTIITDKHWSSWIRWVKKRGIILSETTLASAFLETPPDIPRRGVENSL